MSAHEFSAEAIDADLEEPQRFPLVAGPAFLVGLASCLCLGYPPFIAAALAAIALGFLGLIPRTGFRLHPVAKFMSCAGIALGVFFACGATAERMMTHRRLAVEAERFAKDWLEVIRQKEYEYAAELTKQRGARQFSQANLKEYYAGLKDESLANIEAIKSGATAEATQFSDKPPQWKRVGEAKVSRYFTTYRVEITLQDEAGIVPTPVEVVLKREFDDFTKNNEWHVALNE